MDYWATHYYIGNKKDGLTKRHLIDLIENDLISFSFFIDYLIFFNQRCFPI